MRCDSFISSHGGSRLLFAFQNDLKDLHFEFKKFLFTTAKKNFELALAVSFSPTPISDLLQHFL
jgi:hypothetical protein